MTRKLLWLLLLLSLWFVPQTAQAIPTQCFWVGGTGNFDNTNTASWVTTTGGAVPCVATGGIPKNAGDRATFDANSGGGTITVCGTAAANCPSGSGVLNIGAIDFGNFGGTIDFETRAPVVTLTGNATAWLNGSGTGARTINGNITWNITGAGGNANMVTFATPTNWTNSTTAFNTATFNITNTSTTGAAILVGAITYGTVNLAASTGGYYFQSGPTITTLAITAPNYLAINTVGTFTLTNAPTWTGTSTNFITIGTSNPAAQVGMASASGGTLSWTSIRGISFTGGTWNATSSRDGGANTGITITPPSFGGGSCIGC